MLRPQDIPIWQEAKPHLNVRSNDIHTLVSAVFAQQLLDFYPEAEADIVLPAIILHDTGWSKVPQEKLLLAFGPGAKYPEIQRMHELKGVEVAIEILQKAGFDPLRINAITDIIDGHDTTKEARSLNDAVTKDADKLWRYSSGGITIIQGWFGISRAEVLDILENYVFPTLLTDFGRRMAKSLLEVEKTTLRFELPTNE
ncbi:HD domain-containing protein [Runella slithyformis]|uniref:Metal-dependent phosphohydrolase HD sub domain protein n=1 Tax=Runella slithyformis (strain ATCC 29530 / DSM 19594 / LMG 11500 / NCIMB 11436 / LSU 4) TaxID=761193 RepID=A0A7U4E4B7_RUNSL|nr:HD domain-containing protein [Runella slithyformis]AEI46889.1 metal-dependent phosphohydrolase HD sub domain protein [Runella slithyformis DSM 19594]